MSLSLKIIELAADEKSLTWKGCTSTQAVTFPMKDSLITVLELIERNYGATQEVQGQYCLNLRQAIRLIHDQLPYLAKDARPDWFMLRAKLESPQLHSSISLSDIPSDFDSLFKKALNALEKEAMSKHGLDKAQEKVSYVDHQNAESHIPYDISGLKTTNQLERFKYVFFNRPTIQQLVKHFQLSGPGIWRQYALGTLNPNLTDCEIRHNHNEDVWEVVAKV
jgi:hypothetical protein